MRLKLLDTTLFAFFLFFSINLYAQKDCGTILNESDRKIYGLNIEKVKASGQIKKQLASFYYVRVFIHDFISADATDSAWSYAEVLNEFNKASASFSQYNMCLVLAGIDFPRSNSLKDSFNINDIALLVPFSHSYAIDIFLHKKLQGTAASLNGYAYGIPSKTFSLSRGAITQNSFAHEAGHCLGLVHTFETVFCLECPDGSNGNDCGDKIPDTRATPDADSTINANTSASCIYSGTLSINCNGNVQIYNPEIINIMSYGNRACRSIFSPIQIAVMNFNLENYAPLQAVWFPPIGFTLLAPAPAQTLIIDSDAYFSGNSVQIGNFSTAFNVEIGGNSSQQRIIAPTSILISAGVKLLAPTSERGKIIIRASPYCVE